MKMKNICIERNKGNPGKCRETTKEEIEMEYKSFIFEVRSRYKEFRPSEQKAADIILNEDKRIVDWTIEEFAQAAGVSQPTVIRFVKAAGYQGFKDFKYALMQEEAREEPEEQQESIGLYGFQISRTDPLEEVPGKIINTSVEMLEETRKSISVKEYRKAVEAVLAAENIVIYSVENSICTAMDLLTKLTYLGLNCRIYQDYYLQNVSAVNLTPKDLAIGISYSGCSRHTVEMMAQAKRTGAATLALTNFEHSLIAKYSDIVLCASNRQFLYGNTIFSRISQLALVDMLYAGLLNQDYEKLSGKLNQTNAIVNRRAYGKNEKVL